MLVLSRRPQERIIIGDEIEITVIRISGNRVSLGIHCDRSIPIRRYELRRHEETVADDSLGLSAVTHQVD